MSDAMTGYGSTFEFRLGDDTSSAFDAAAECTSLTPPSSSVDIIDVSNMDSPDSFREFIQGLTDPGELSVGMNFVPGSDTDDNIRAWRSSREVRDWKITFPNGVVMSGQGFVSGYELDAPFDDKMSATLTIKVTGAITVA